MKKFSLHSYLVSKNKEFTDQAEHGIVDVVGDDKAGRKIIVVSACKFPANRDFDNQRFSKLVNYFCKLTVVSLIFRYLMATLDQYVDMDYSLVYFHHGLSSKTKPQLSWLWSLYKVVTIYILNLSITTMPGSG